MENTGSYYISGFKGWISALHVNFEKFSLQHTAHWQGHGSPEYGVDIQTDNSGIGYNISIQIFAYKIILCS